MEQDWFSPTWRLRVQRQCAGFFQKRNVGRRGSTDTDDFDATVGGNRMLDAGRHVYGTTGMEGQMNIVGIVVDRTFALENENRIFRYRMDVRDVCSPGSSTT